jgi:hypothetical protein
MMDRTLTHTLAVFVHELPLAAYEQGLEVVIGITSFVPRRSIADFEIHDFFGGFVNQAVSVGITSGVGPR